MYLSWMTICQRDPRIAVAIHVQELDAVSGGGYLNVDYIRAGGIVSLVFLVPWRWAPLAAVRTSAGAQP